MATPEQLRADQQELAQKLAAAYLAHILRLKSIDRVLKVYVLPHAPINQDWIELAKHALMIQHKLGTKTATRRKQ